MTKEAELCECGAPMYVKPGTRRSEIPQGAFEPYPDPEDGLDYNWPRNEWGRGALRHCKSGIRCNQRMARVRAKRDSLFPAPWSTDWAKVVSKVAELRPSFRVEMCLDHEAKGLAYRLWVPPQAIPIMRTQAAFIDTDLIDAKTQLPIRKVNVDAVMMILNGAEMSQDDIDVMFVQAMLELDPD